MQWKRTSRQSCALEGERSEAMIVGRAARAGACLRSGRAHGSIRASFAGVLTESAGEGITRLDAPID
jgi:hypothetical protein